MEQVIPGKRPILVVDDDETILSTVCDILQFEGYSTECAANGEEGLRVLETVKPKLVLLDMRMPVLDGWQFAQILKERGIKIPIVVMTAAQDAKEWAREIEANGYLPKPFDYLDLLAAVEAHMARNGNGNGDGSQHKTVH
ncbi:MAG TPA: response regulator [Chloroflexia bacterium]|jgi:DNA-binding response OmpR family regulator